jgi:hypothetical protein
LSDLQTSGYLDKINSSQTIKISQSESSDIFTASERDELIRLRERVSQLEEALEGYKQREAQLFRVLETREQQEKRRKFWSFGNNN